jgi:hypothetical protein
MFLQHRLPALSAFVAILSVLHTGCGGGGGSDSGSDPSPGGGGSSVSVEIRTLSSRPDIVSAGDTLLQVRPSANGEPAKLRVLLNGADVTDRFRVQSDGRTLVGLMDKSEPKYSLRVGNNSVDVLYDGALKNSLSVVNHPVSGPVFSGPQETPFVCETASFILPSGATLGAPLDQTSCSASVRVQYVYWSTVQNRFVHLANPSSVPADAGFATIEGRRVPLVVRTETGTINRAIYQLRMLHNPSTDPAPSAFSSPAGWNGRLIYTFGGGCTEGWYRQGNQIYGLDDYQLLVRGYALASSSLNIFGQNCSELLAAETMAMVKERFIEAHGVPRFTIGYGCSGGAYQLHHIADNYPGLLDGLLVGCSYPEVTFTTVHYMSDARLMNRYFQGFYYPAPSLNDEQKKRISGFESVGTIPLMDGAAERIVPTNCPGVLSAELRYSLAGNPNGARCDLFDHSVNIWGTKANPLAPGARPIAQRPLDNVGVQYGLQALRTGAITVDQFLDLNEKIGGFDSDGRPTADVTNTLPAPRSVADPATLRTAYTSGRMLYAGWGLRDVPIVDYRLYEDRNAQGAFHLRYHSFITRERLRKANGSADNQVMLLEGSASDIFSSASPLVRHGLDQLDLWLQAIVADSSADPLRQKVVRHRPASLREGCVPPGQQFPSFVAETLSLSAGTCAGFYPAGIGPRAASGGPTIADVVKCALRSVDAAIAANDYGVQLSPAQVSRLRTIFPGGVCDWSRPGIGQPTPEEYASLNPWQSFD